MAARLLSSAELDFARLVRPGDLVLSGQGCAEPLTLTRKLVAERHAIGPFSVFLGIGLSDTFAPERSDGIQVRAYGAIGTNAALSRAGRLDVLAWPYSRLEKAFVSGELRADVVLLQLAEGCEGRYSLSLSNDYVAAAARNARVVVAEVNPHAPFTHGAALPEGVTPHVWVRSDGPPQALKPARFGAVEEAIAGHVAGLIPDGACLQFGVGAVPVAALTSLKGHRELGIHSGVIGDVCVDLIEAGAITNAKKPFDQGISITNVVLGTRRLFDHVHDNPAIEVRRAACTHDHATIAAIPDYRAINSGLQVDLMGRVNAEVANGAYVGGIGGQRDFVQGALASPGGRSIIALPATALAGQASRIVQEVERVTIAESDADLVVTEFGVADLRGASPDERARRMIAIAAPDFRDDLARSWRDADGS